MQCQRSKFHHNQLGEVTLNRSSRAKRVSISIRPDGEVRLTLPPRGSESEARNFLESKIEWIVAAKQKMAQRAAAQPVVKESSVEEIVALCHRANEYLPNRLAMLAERFSFNYRQVAIRILRSKWGSCTSDNRISLSIFLMKLPEELIDFVLIHELCHTIHHNHSKEFHALVNSCTQGRERELHKALKGYSCR